MANIKVDRVLELFLRGLRGEALSSRKLADEYHVSQRSISRDIVSLQQFLADHRDLLGNAQLVYSNKDHSYQLVLDEFLTNKELLAVIECLIGSRPFNREELIRIIEKLKKYTTINDREKLDDIISKEIYHYKEINFDCGSIIDNVYDMINYIDNKQKITITYYKMDRTQVKRTIFPLAIMFSEYYFYLIASMSDDDKYSPKYFRIDRISHVVAHREHFKIPREYEFDEGELRNRSQFMWPGKLQKIKFEFTVIAFLLPRLYPSLIIPILSKPKSTVMVSRCIC